MWYHRRGNVVSRLKAPVSQSINPSKFLRCVTPKTLKNDISRFPALELSTKESCGEKAGSFAFSVVRKDTLGHTSIFMWPTGGGSERQVVYPLSCSSIIKEMLTERELIFSDEHCYVLMFLLA